MLIAGIVSLALLPLLLSGWQRGMHSMFNNPKNWVSGDSKARQRFGIFAGEFREVDTIIISWPGCTVDDDRLERFSQELTESNNAERAELCRQFFARVSTGYTAVRQFMEPPFSLSRTDALARLDGLLVGPDGKTSCATIELSRAGDDRRSEAIQFVLQIAGEVCQLKETDFYLGGTPVDGATIDRHSVESAQLYALPSNLVVILLCRLFLRSWPFALVVFVIAAIGQLLGIALVHYCGYPMNAILIVMPPLILVLTVSAGVHLVSYYHDEVRAHSTINAARRAIANGWVPCLLTAVTSIFGLSSLLMSDIIPVEQFGGFASVCIAATIALLFLILPGAMHVFPVQPRVDSTGQPAWTVRWVERLLDGMSDFVCRRHAVIAGACVGMMFVAGFGLTRTKTSVNVRSLFLPESRILSDYRWLEDHLGPTVPVEIVIRILHDCPLDLIERLELVRDVENEVANVPLVGGTISATTFLPDLGDPLGDPGAAHAVPTHESIREMLAHMEAMHYLHEDASGQSWRISARVAALEDIDYGEFLQQLESRVKPLVGAAREKSETSKIYASYTGAMSLAYDTQRALLNDLFVSFLTALAIITLALMIYLRSFRGGLIVMFPNLFPTVLLFGLAGLRNLAIDIGSVMTASVALGIAVDDTVHFLVWFRREYAAGCSRAEAVRQAFRHCAPAMVQTTLICGLGLLVYTFSSFVPTRRFAWMMWTLLFAALVGDLLLLPALLAGPLGAWLRPRVSEADSASDRHLSVPENTP